MRTFALEHYQQRHHDMINCSIESRLPRLRQYLATLPIKRAWLFGSCLRGEETEQSDADILVEYDRTAARISLMSIAGMALGMERILHRTVDLVENGRLLPFAARTAERYKLLIYERIGQKF